MIKLGHVFFFQLDIIIAKLEEKSTFGKIILKKKLQSSLQLITKRLGYASLHML